MILWLFDTAPVSSGGYLTPGGVNLRLYDTVPFLLFVDLFFAKLSYVLVSTEARLSLISILTGHPTTNPPLHPSNHQTAGKVGLKQAGNELCQAQVKLEVIV